MQLSACSPLQNIQEKANATRMQRQWTLQDRKQQYTEDAARHERNTAAAAEGKPLEHFWRSLYQPDQGMFCVAPADLQLGTLQKVCSCTSSSRAQQERLRLHTPCLVCSILILYQTANQSALELCHGCHMLSC